MPQSSSPATVITAPEANAPALWRQAIPQRDDAGHKYSRGHCIVWSGPELATGAARLSARSALRIGAGLVTLAGTRDALLVHAAHETSVMLRRIETLSDWAHLLENPRIRGVAIGPAAGVGENTREVVLTALAANVPTVLDADALTSFGDRSDTLGAAIRSQNRPVILTPHEGEFAVLFGGHGKLSREGEIRSAAAVCGGIIVLKGNRTLIAAPDGRLVVNDNAPPTLATAGSGDVLTGITAGLITQGMPGFEAACCAVWLHGEIGKLAGPHLIADDLVDAIRCLPAFEAIR